MWLVKLAVTYAVVRVSLARQRQPQIVGYFTT